MKCHCSILADFKNGHKNVKTFLKEEQISLFCVIALIKVNMLKNDEKGSKSEISVRIVFGVKNCCTYMPIQLLFLIVFVFFDSMEICWGKYLPFKA